MQRPYLIDTEDNEDFFLGCGLDESEAEVTDLRPTTWGGFTPLAIPGLRDAWKNPKRRELQAQVMKRNWEEGRIKAHPPSPQISAIRRRSTSEVWERRRRGEIPKPSHNGRNRPCTVDGITIYPSAKALIKALGKGKNGYAHPNFRFVKL